MAYKTRGSIDVEGIQTLKVIPTLQIEDSGDIMTQNLGKVAKNVTGAQ